MIQGNGTPLQYSCLDNPMDGGAWWAAVHGVAKSRTWLSDFTFTFHFNALEKEMATHSSVLAWRIPGMGSHRVGHDRSDLAVADKWSRELRSKGIGEIISSGQEFLKTEVFFMLPLESKDCDHIVKNCICVCVWPQFYSQILDQMLLNLALIIKADWSQQGTSFWGSRGLSLISPRLLNIGRSPGHKGASAHFPMLCQ